MNLAEACARAAHEVNNVFNEAIGDIFSPKWKDMTDAQRVGAIVGAEHAIAGGTPEESHALWMASRVAEGWVYGPVKSFGEKTSPCLIPYAELPLAQRAKDALFQSVVRAMADALSAREQRAPEVPAAGAPRPSVGRIVHYQAYGTPGGEYPSVPRAAVITETRRENSSLEEMTVGLCVLNPTGQFFNRNVPFSETPRPGCWSWPPRS